MPGKIFKIIKNSGDVVIKGETVLIVEAMKMEHSIKATRDGIISQIFYSEGDQVQGGVALCEID
jgi:biotin carboxyl carrier protein